MIESHKIKADSARTNSHQKEITFEKNKISDRKNKKIRVLHVVRRMNRGGTETLLMNILRTADRTKYQFDFVEQTNEPCDYDNEIISLGSKIYHSPHITPLNLYSYRMWWRHFFRVHPEYKIIHGHSRGSAPVYLDEARKAGCITIVHCHSNSLGSGLEGIIRNIWQFPLRRLADYKFACSQGAGIVQFGKNSHFNIIKNGIITNKYTWNPNTRKKVREQYAIGDNFVVGNVARFEDVKNHTFIVKVFRAILKRKPEAVLVLVGQGPLERNIRQQVAEYHIENNVIFAGVRSDVENYLQAMDVFLLPSLYEGLPLSIVEAQAAGLPCFVSKDVVSTEVDITELVHHISLKQSPEEWADVILSHSIRENERKSYSQEIKNAGYDITTTTNWLCDFYADKSSILSNTNI